jgi:hypothetical protein
MWRASGAAGRDADMGVAANPLHLPRIRRTEDEQRAIVGGAPHRHRDRRAVAPEGRELTKRSVAKAALSTL